MSAKRLLSIVLVALGVVFLLVYPLSIVWPAGWAWHAGAPYESDYFLMIVGVYATLGVFLILAARDPLANLSLIWFTIVSSAIHGTIMAVQSFGHTGNMDHMGHLYGDVPALYLVVIVLTVLVFSAQRETTGSQAKAVP